MQNEKPLIGITTGDLNGVGPELIIKTLSDTRILDICTPVVFSSNKVINFYRKTIAETPFNFSNTKDLTKLAPKQVNIFTCWDEEVPIQRRADHRGSEGEPGWDSDVGALPQARDQRRDLLQLA